MRSTLLLLLLPGMAATDNAICAVMNPLMQGLDSVPGLMCSCVGDGTALNIGGDSKCEFEIAKPDLKAIEDMMTSSYFFKLDLGTTIRPCDEPAKAELAGGIYLPLLTQEESSCTVAGAASDAANAGAGAVSDAANAASDTASSGISSVTSSVTSLGRRLASSCDATLDLAVSTAVAALNDEYNAALADASSPPPASSPPASNFPAFDVSYVANENKVAISMSMEAGKTKSIELPIMKWVVADFFIELSLTVNGNAAALTTTQTVDLCMKAGNTKICGAQIPKCDGTDSGSGAIYTAQQAICNAGSTNWHALFGSPPIQMVPSVQMTFTDACAPSSPPPPPPPAPSSTPPPPPPASTSTTTAPPPPPAVTLTVQASGSVTDYADTSDLKANIASAAGVAISDVAELTVQAASVIITAVINVPSSTTAAAVSDSLTNKLSSAEAASTELGITVENVPTVTATSSSSGGGGGGLSGGATAAVVIVVLLILAIAGCVIVKVLVKKGKMKDPLERLKDMSGKRSVQVAEANVKEPSPASTKK